MVPFLVLPQKVPVNLLAQPVYSLQFADSRNDPPRETSVQPKWNQMLAGSCRNNGDRAGLRTTSSRVKKRRTAGCTLRSSAQSVSPAESADPKNTLVTPLQPADPKTKDLKSLRIR